MPTRILVRMWHPWRVLRDRLDITLIWTDDLSDGVLGATDGARICMPLHQLQAEWRCTLTDELIHIEPGHRGCQPPAIEAEVSHRSGSALHPLNGLVRTVVWAASPEELADELWVDLNMLFIRLDTCTDRERRVVNASLARKD